jgi:hypothetical protein
MQPKEGVEETIILLESACHRIKQLAESMDLDADLATREELEAVAGRSLIEAFDAFDALDTAGKAIVVQRWDDLIRFAPILVAGSYRPGSPSSPRPLRPASPHARRPDRDSTPL